MSIVLQWISWQYEQCSLSIIASIIANHKLTHAMTNFKIVILWHIASVSAPCDTNGSISLIFQKNLEFMSNSIIVDVDKVIALVYHSHSHLAKIGSGCTMCPCFDSMVRLTWFTHWFMIVLSFLCSKFKLNQLSVYCLDAICVCVCYRLYVLCRIAIFIIATLISPMRRSLMWPTQCVKW